MRSARLGSIAAFALGCAAAFVPSTAQAAAITVSPGESIQDAVDAATPGSTIIVLPGDYVETHGGFASVRITKSLKLVAKSKLPDLKVRILPGPGQTSGILIEPENPGDPDVERVTVQGFTVEGYSRNGIWTRHANRFRIIGNELINCDHVGIFPTLSANGLVKKNLAYGTLDAALWVEAATNVRVIKNEFRTSPTGLEISISTNIKVKKNHVHHNTVGVGLYPANFASIASPYTSEENGDWDITGNYIHDNNFPNPVTGGLVGALPAGIGVLHLGIDRVTYRKNQILNNDFLGLGLLDYCFVIDGETFDCNNDPPIHNPAPDDNVLINNEITGNGGNPPSGGIGFLAADVLSIGSTTNCRKNNSIGLLVGVLAPC
ncbi:MAG: right-handed parallel beta-helix repeat-containing protein [Candidatus Binatia bacterium]|nr:right-handed parallel beta-helix repeat-containing protein [Candidatus Binatia bacterium]